MAKSNYFYSNCFIEMLKAKIHNPQVKITYLPPSINECFCPHWMWSDGINNYDFGIERYVRPLERLWFKGHIRKRFLGFNKTWKQNRIDKQN